MSWNPSGRRPEHAQRERELRERGRPDPCGAHAAAALRATAAHCSSPRTSARAVGSTPAPVSTASARSPSTGVERAAQHLAALGEAGAHQREELRLRRHRHRRRRPAAHLHEHRIDLGARHEHRRRDDAHDRRLGVVRDLHRHRAVLLVARARRRVARRPRAAPSPACGRRPAPPRGRAPPPAPRRCTAGSTRTTTGHDPASSAGQSTSSASATRDLGAEARAVEHRLEHVRRDEASSSTATHVRSRVEQGEGQRSDPRADLDDQVARRRPRRARRCAARCWDRRGSADRGSSSG